MISLPVPCFHAYRLLTGQNIMFRKESALQEVKIFHQTIRSKKPCRTGRDLICSDALMGQDPMADTFKLVVLCKDQGIKTAKQAIFRSMGVADTHDRRLLLQLLIAGQLQLVGIQFLQGITGNQFQGVKGVSSQK